MSVLFVSQGIIVLFRGMLSFMISVMLVIIVLEVLQRLIQWLRVMVMCVLWDIIVLREFQFWCFVLKEFINQVQVYSV